MEAAPPYDHLAADHHQAPPLFHDLAATGQLPISAPSFEQKLTGWTRLLMPWKRANKENRAPVERRRGGSEDDAERDSDEAASGAGELTLSLPPVPERTLTGKPYFTTLTNYADCRLGAHVIFATDEFKCSAAGILADAPALVWTTRRRRVVGNDWCFIKLPVPINVRGVEIHSTNHAPPHVSIEGGLELQPVASRLYSRLQHAFPGYIPRAADKGLMSGGSTGHPMELQNLADEIVDAATTWRSVIGVSPLRRNQINYYEVLPDDDGQEFKVDLIRLNLLPDGGIARLKIYGECALDLSPVFRLKERESDSRLLDYAAAVNGGQVVWATAGRATAQNMLMPGHDGNQISIASGPQGNMISGDTADDLRKAASALPPCSYWVTPRQPLRPTMVQQDLKTDELKFAGSEHAVISLAARCVVTDVEISTSGNHSDLPYKLIVSIFDSSPVRKLSMLRQKVLFGRYPDEISWLDIGTLVGLGGDEEYTVTLTHPAPVTHVRLLVIPDGGITRVRVRGQICDFEDDVI